MHITVVGMVKNAADIIESYIRANGLFADKFVLVDNDSNDNTRQIIENLKSEGYDIDLLYDGENAYLQSMKTTLLIQRAARQYETDWIIPLDDDEILFSVDGRNVKDILSGWDKAQAYFVPWRVYIPTEEDDPEEICIPKRMNYAFAEGCDTDFKIIFSSETAREDKFRIVQGNHNFIGIEVNKIYSDELILAHYPVRSKEQIISKALVGWTNNLAMPYRKESNGLHWFKIYEQVKRNFDISVEQMWQIAMLYIKNVDSEKLSVLNMPLGIDEKAFVIKYTTLNEINPLMNYFANTESLAVAYKKLLTEKFDGNDR